MNKKIKKLLVIFFFMFLTLNSADAKLLWDINTGIDEFKCKNYIQAKIDLENYTKNNPNDEDGYYWLGRTYHNLNDKNNSIKNFKKAYEIALNEKNIERITFNLNNDFNIEDYFDMASMYYEIKDYKEAKLYADMMLNINKKSYGAYFLKAKIAHSENDIQKAIEYINKAIFFNNKLLNTNLAKTLNITEIPEMDKKTYETMALEYAYSNDIESAIKYTKKYLEYDNENNGMKNLLIDLYIKNNELILAQSVLDEVLSTTRNIPTLINQIKIYQLKNDKKEIDILNEAYNINPNNSKILLMLGNYYLKENDFDNAKKYYEILTMIDDNSFEGYYGYIFSLIELGETEQITNLIRKFTSLNPDSSEQLFLLSKLCAKTENYKEALDYISQAIKKNKLPEYIFKKAELHYLNNDYDNSLSDLYMLSNLPNSKEYKEKSDILAIKNFIKLSDYKNAQTLLNHEESYKKNKILYKYYLYVLYELQGENIRAQNEYKELKKIKPITIKDYINLSEVLLEENKAKEAKKIINKALKKYSNPELNIQKYKINALFK